MRLAPGELSGAQRSWELRLQELPVPCCGRSSQAVVQEAGCHPGLLPPGTGRAGPYETPEPMAPATLLVTGKEVGSIGGEHPGAGKAGGGSACDRAPASAEPASVQLMFKSLWVQLLASAIREIPLGQSLGLPGARNREEAGRPQPWHPNVHTGSLYAPLVSGAGRQCEEGVHAPTPSGVAPFSKDCGTSFPRPVPILEETEG